jgi:hypothetical protein
LKLNVFGNTGSVAIYKLRYFFDTGSGTCLWSANDTARDHFDYPVDINQLPLSTTLRYRVWFVLAWYDTFLDWENAPQPSQWWITEQEPFNQAAQEVLQLLKQELQEEFEVIDESKTLRQP